ncbi:hypothetical protein cypCar_00014637, partial [Cyprinus carpio]
SLSPIVSGVCGCCGALRPRYKRLVDNIFPEDPEDGLVKANMEKLTFYALSAPEKLDRIGAYLSERLSRDVARHRYGYVCIAMEALDQLLMACHCQTINLFVESFLTMVRKLLEADKPNLQILGTNSLAIFLIMSPSPETEKERESPVELTERCFRELLGRAAYGNIKNAVKPVLIFGSVPYLSTGPTVLEVFNTLLKQLRLSVDYELTGSYDSFANMGSKVIKVHEERQLQEAVIKTVGSFAYTLPPYQRSEVMLFIIGKIPVPGMYPALGSANTGVEGSRMIQVMLLKSLLQVTAGFQSTNILTALPTSFLDPLLSFTLMEDAEIRLLVLDILIGIIDRHDNRHKFSPVRIISDISVLKLKVDKCSRQDNLFMKKHSQRLYRHIYLACKEESSVQRHFESLYTLLALICVELANEEVVVDLIRLALALQVIESRKKLVPFLLPEDVLVESSKIPEKLEKVEGEVLFVQTKIAEILGGSGYNTERLATAYIPQITDEDRLSKRKSIGDTVSLQLEMESRNSPEKEQRSTAEQITFETLKQAVVDSVNVEELERERRRQVVERFQTAPFEEIAAHCGARASLLQSKLNQIFEITIRPPPSPSGSVGNGHGPSRSIPVYEMKFPDLCVY